jgi:hypothetical protein
LRDDADLLTLPRNIAQMQKARRDLRAGAIILGAGLGDCHIRGQHQQSSGGKTSQQAAKFRTSCHFFTFVIIVWI